MLAGMIFNIDVIFKGKDNNDQLTKIAKILGTKELFDYLDKYDIKMKSIYDGILAK
jgi:casein kinase II subunit alpha